MRKYLSTLVALGVALAFIVSGCTTWQSWFGETHYTTFELTIDEQKVIVNLPAELSSMDNAVKSIEGCFNADVCVQRFCSSEDLGHDHVDFVYIETDVVALIWINEKEPDKRFLVWIYIEKKSISVPISRIKDLIKEHDPNQ